MLELGVHGSPNAGWAGFSAQEPGKGILFGVTKDDGNSGWWAPMALNVEGEVGIGLDSMLDPDEKLHVAGKIKATEGFCIDDDCIAQPGYLAAYAATIEADPALGALEGHIFPDRPPVIYPHPDANFPCVRSGTIIKNVILYSYCSRIFI